jgi:hypothetical protein
VGVCADAGDSLGDSPVVLDEGRDKPSEAHVDVDWHVPLQTVGADDVDWIAGAVRVVGVRSVDADGILVDVALHFADVHLVVLIEGHDSGLYVEVVACLESSDVARLADDEIGLENAVHSHLILPVGENGHQDGLGSSRLAGSAGLSLLVLEADGLGCHLDHFVLHLLDEGEHLDVQRVRVGEQFGQTHDEFAVILQGVSRPRKLALQRLLFRGVSNHNVRHFVGDFIERW